MKNQTITKVTIKLQKQCKDKLPELAKQYRVQNTSDLLRLILLDYIANPKALSITPLQVFDNENIEVSKATTTLTENQIESLTALSKNIVKLKYLYTLVIEDFINNPRDLKIELNTIDK